MADVRILVDAQTRDANTNLRGVGDALDSLGSRAKAAVGGIGAMGVALGSLASSAISAGIGAITGSIGGLVSAMIDGNAEFERYQTQFSVLLGGADEAKKRLEELAKFGASTPFELPEVVKADKILQSFGLHSEESAKKFGSSGEQIRTIAGDVASGVGVSFEEMTLLLGKFSTGATGEAISRMAELGITSREELSKMGLEFSKSGELLSPLPQSMETVLKLMKDKFGGMMAAQSSTFEGMMSNLQDWVAGTLRTVGQPIFEKVREKLGELLQFLGSSDVQTAISAFATGLADGMARVIGLIESAIPSVVEFAQGIAGVILAEAPGVIQKMADALQAALPFLRQMGQEMLSTFKEAWPTVQQILILLGELVKTIFGAIQTFLEKHGETIKTLIKGVWEFIRLVIENGLDAIKTIIQVAINIINGDWKAAWNTIVSFLQRVWERIKSVISTALDSIKATMLAAWNSVVTSVQEKFGLVRTEIAAEFDKIKQFMESLPATFLRFGTAIIEGIAQGIRNGAEAVRVALSDFLRRTLPAWVIDLLGIASPSKVFAEIGKQIPAGLAMGILAGQGSVFAALSQVMGATPSYSMGVMAGRNSAGLSFTFSDSIQVVGGMSVARDIQTARREATRQAMLRAAVVGG